MTGFDWLGEGGGSQKKGAVSTIVQRRVLLSAMFHLFWGRHFPQNIASSDDHLSSTTSKLVTLAVRSFLIFLLALTKSPSE